MSTVETLTNNNEENTMSKIENEISLFEAEGLIDLDGLDNEDLEVIA